MSLLSREHCRAARARLANEVGNRRAQGYGEMQSECFCEQVVFMRAR